MRKNSVRHVGQIYIMVVRRDTLKLPTNYKSDFKATFWGAGGSNVYYYKIR
jgi:hypothetical protein